MGGSTPRDDEEEESTLLEDNEHSRTMGVSLGKTGVFNANRILSCPPQCIHPRIRDAVEAEEREALLGAARLLEEHGTPDEVARRVALGPRSDGLPPLDSGDSVEESRANYFFTPSFTSPGTAHATLHDADEELGRRCQFFVSVITDDNEPYHVPYDVQRRVVPLLYSWLVDWDFLRRHISSWERVAECFCRVVHSRRRHFAVRPDFSLPWRPLVEILISVFFQCGRVLDLNDFHHLRKVTGKHFGRVCELAALHFDVDALEGLWETFAPFFSVEREEASLALCLFSHLIPVHRLVDDETGAPLALTERIVRFLLEDSIYWQQQSRNWLSYSLKVIFKMSLHQIGVVEFDKYAETLFSAILFQLRLPIAEGTEAPPAVSGFGVLNAIPFFNIHKVEMCSAYGFIGNMLPRRTDSPLWNHLRRFILATSVFLNPTTANTGVLPHLFTFFGSLVACVHLRMKKQAKFEFVRAKGLKCVKQRPIPEAYLWNSDTIESFVALMAPVLISCLHHRLDDAPRIVGLLASLAPTVVQPLILPYVSAGLRGGVGSQAQRTVALRLLVKTLYPLSECRATRDELWSFLADVILLLLPWIGPGEPTLSVLVLDVIFATCSITKLRDLLGSQDVERDFAMAFLERLFECSSHVEIEKGHVFQHLVWCAHALSINVSDETLEFCVTKVVKEAGVRGTLSKAQAVSCLLEPFARRAPERVMHWAAQSLMPPLQNASALVSEVQWCVHLLAGCVRGAGLACFPQRHELLRCIQCQASHVTENERLLAAATLYSAVYAAFTETVCLEVRATEASAQAVDDSDVHDLDLLKFDTAQDAFEMSMGFYRSNSFQLTWREASEVHIAYVFEVYQRFVQNIVDVICNIDHGVFPQASDCSEGLRSLFLFHNPCNDKTRRSSEGDDSVEQKLTDTTLNDAEGGENFTPRNVLRGVLYWLQMVLEINQELRAWCCSAEDAPNMVPWWWQIPKTTLLFPVSPASLLSPSSSSSLLPFMHEAIHDFLLKHAMRPLLGNLAEENAIGRALKLDFSHLLQGEPLSGGDSDAADMDIRGLRCVLAILSEQCNINPRTALTYNPYRKYTMCPRMFNQYIVEPLRSRRYFPALYWQLKADSFTRTRRSFLMHAISPKRLAGLLSVTHTLLFSSYQSLKLDCCHILSECIPLLDHEATRRFFARHFAVLRRIVELWEKEHDSTDQRLNYHDTTTDALVALDNERDHENAGGGLDDSEANAVSVCGQSESSATAATNNNTNKNNRGNADASEERGSVLRKKAVAPHLSKLKRELYAILPALPIDLNSTYFYYDPELIQRKHELLLDLPDHIFSKLADGIFFLNATTNLGKLKTTMENERAVLLCDNLLHIASKCSVAMPDRAFICLTMVIAFYRPSRMALLSPQSVCLLFRLTLNSHKKLRVLSLHVLHALLLALKKSHSKAHVLARRGALEDAGNTNFFSHRYQVLKQRCKSFYGMGDLGLVFLPKAVRVDAEDVVPDMFNDGDVASVPAESLVRRKAYIWEGNEGDGTKERTDEEEAQEQERKKRRRELRQLIACLSGILDEELNPDSVTESNMDCEYEAKMREGWIWSVIQRRQDQKNFSKCQMQVWKALGKLSGVEPSVRFFTRLVRLLVKDFMELSQCINDAAKESPKWLFSCISDMLVATIRISKRHPKARQEALACYVEILMLVCTSWRVPHDVHQSFVLSISELHDTLKTDEVWFIYLPLFEALTTPPLKETSATNQHASGNKMEADTTTSATTSLAGGTQTMVRVLTIIAQLLCVFAHEINVELLPKLCQQVMMKREVLLCSTVMLIRYRAAAVIQQIMRLSLHQSSYITLNSDVLSSIVKFLDCVERLVELPPLPAPDSLPTLAPWSETPALGAASHSFLPSSDVSAGVSSPEFQIGSSLAFSEGFSLDGGNGATPLAGLAAIKTFLAYWYQPPQPILNMRIQTVIPFFVRCLDISLQDVDNFYEMIQATLNSIVYIRLPKDTVHGVLELLCDILEEKRPYGRSWQAKVILSQTMCLFLFTNLHRIGKFAFMESVSRAALRSIGHGDGRVRKEGKQLLAVLTKVASVEQTRAIVYSFFGELRGLSTVTSSATGGVTPSPEMLQEKIRKRRRSALLLALCSILSADPGIVPPYAPRLMERLAYFANDPAPEVQRAVKQAFGDWWRSHREGWELEHKSHFTPAQIEVIAPLMAPSYLV